jgi:hypothetical protein
MLHPTKSSCDKRPTKRDLLGHFKKRELALMGDNGAAKRSITVGRKKNAFFFHAIFIVEILRHHGICNQTSLDQTTNQQQLA